jgi:molecular chaperone DnaK (HSP70)
MPGRLGIDFGTSNTVVTLWNCATADSAPVQLGDYSKLQAMGSESLFIVPSLIHYGTAYTYDYGNEVLQKNLKYSQRTFQWMKRYISERCPIERSIDDRKITNYDAGRRFLSEILSAAAKYTNQEDEEIVLTVPVESFEFYSHWLCNVVDGSNIGRYRIIDEPTAAALGYDIELVPENVYLVFDFGGGTLDVAIICIESNGQADGPLCRVLGKAGVDLGGTSIDEWLYQAVLKDSGLSEQDDDWKAISRIVLLECERLKESLSFKEHTELSVLNPFTGSMLRKEFSRLQLEELLDKHDAFSKIDRTIRRALKAANERGVSDDEISAVLMVGGCSQIPSVKTLVKRIFGNDKVLLRRPLDAVARGASRFAAGMAFKDYIQHDYAIRYVNPLNGKYEYKPIVRRGTHYPTGEPVAVLTIKAAFEGQEQMGLPIFEIGSSSAASTERRMELIFDQSGVPALQAVQEKEAKRRTFFWINENNPTFLTASPAGERGEPKFTVRFSIDTNRKLLITAQNVETQQIVLTDYPVAKLI